MIAYHVVGVLLAIVFSDTQIRHAITISPQKYSVPCLLKAWRALVALHVKFQFMAYSFTQECVILQPSLNSKLLHVSISRLRNISWISWWISFLWFDWNPTQQTQTTDGSTHCSECYLTDINIQVSTNDAPVVHSRIQAVQVAHKTNSFCSMYDHLKESTPSGSFFAFCFAPAGWFDLTNCLNNLYIWNKDGDFKACVCSERWEG